MDGADYESGGDGGSDGYDGEGPRCCYKKYKKKIEYAKCDEENGDKKKDMKYCDDPKAGKQEALKEVAAEDKQEQEDAVDDVKKKAEAKKTVEAEEKAEAERKAEEERKKAEEEKNQVCCKCMPDKPCSRNLNGAKMQKIFSKNCPKDYKKVAKKNC